MISLLKEPSDNLICQEVLEVEGHPGPDASSSEAAPIADDLYRDDPYRFEGDGEPVSFAKLSETDDMRRIDYLPTPAEISGVCAEIRAQWSPSEKRRRYVGELPPEALDDGAWAPPVIDTSHFRLASSGMGETV